MKKSRSPADDAVFSDGLTSAQAAAILAENGANELPAAPSVPAWRLLLSQMVHFFALMLWVAGLLAFIAGMPQLGFAIFVIIIVNGLFSFAQEQRAQRASDRLSALLPVRVVVKRDGSPLEIDASQVVVGDLVILSAGDRVVADMTAVEAHGLELDESTLTGEAEPVEVIADSMLWAGTFVVSGEGTAAVCATGVNTQLAGIAALTASAERPPGPLALELRRIVRIMAVLTVSVGAAFFILTLFTGTPARDGFLFAVGITVALVPEGLLPTLTLSLAMGAQRMAHKNALVRHLQAVETLGSTTFICTDKTGTLTRNEMSVVQIWTPVGSVHIQGEGYAPVAEILGSQQARSAAAQAASAAQFCSQGRAVEQQGSWVAIGDPMECAIDASFRRLSSSESPSELSEIPTAVRRFAFDPQRRRASASTQDWLFAQGAPDAMFPLCLASSDLETSLIESARKATEDLASQGLRVLAVARRLVGTTIWSSAEEAEQQLELLGLIGLQDPPRAEAKASIAACRSAGIKLAMITGDHPSTAQAIAEQVGLLGPHGLVLTGEELPETAADLAALLDHDGVVVSRATPADKLRIAEALQGLGHVVAMTGDGVNDGPALRKADIGIAMGASGTDVAREAADLVLLDDNFATIVAAIEEGRATFTNIRRFLTYHLTDNVAELTPFLIWGLSGGRFPLAIGVLQVLCLDIVTDLLPALALGAEPPSPGLLSRPLTGRHLIDSSLLRRVFGVLGPTEAVIEMAAFVTGLVAVGWRPGDSFPTGNQLLAASGAAFAAVVLGQVANAHACRSATRPPWRLGWTSNHLMNLALLVQLLLLVGLLAIPPVAKFLGQAVPSPAAALVACSAIPALLVVDALHKLLRSKRSHPNQVPESQPKAAAGNYSPVG
jgi:calcium-translocating P-type ATPase